jgi:D-2-hydroxyacid dehydrogenase (NADP+)
MKVEILVLEIEQPPDLAIYEQAISRACPDVQVRMAASMEDALRCCGEASALAAKAHDVSAELLAAMPRLRWIQALTTGVDHLVAIRPPREVLVTNVRGLHGPQMAELAFLYMLAISRDFVRMRRNQQAAVWERWPQPLLFGKTAAIVGVGAISEALALRCKAFGMNVVGVSSHRKTAPGFDAVAPREALVEVAKAADFLIALVPYSEETHHLIDRKVLAALKRDAAFINIARGKVVDEEALVEALSEKRIRGAGLDVFETEPPTPDHPLWRCESAIMTPRIGGMSDVYAQQASAMLAENLNLFASGEFERMRNRVEI